MRVERIGEIVVEGGTDAYARLTLEEADVEIADALLEPLVTMEMAIIKVCRDWVDKNIHFDSKWHLSGIHIMRVPNRDQCIAVVYLREDI